ncbi:DUF2807 domain-containing protein [Crocinitomix sp.]|nr:DUF2807 domain-containing protein [Crocinitomix sp.]
MKHFILVTFLFLINYTAKAGDFEVEVSIFHSIEILGNFKVTAQKGEVEKVEIKNLEDDLADEKIICKVKNQVLTVRIKGDLYTEKNIEILITYTNIHYILAKYGCRLEVKGQMEADELEFQTESGGKIKADIKVDKVKATIGTGGSIRLLGTANEATYKISAGGTIGAISLMANKVTAKITAGGEVICSVKNDLSINITSGGTVSYMGEPKAFEQKITLGGTITKMASPE